MAGAVAGSGSVGDYLALLKPRVMSLVVFTALVGVLAAPGHIHPWLGAITVLAIAAGAGASGALNMWYDADIDARMRRTECRPVPRGVIAAGDALGFGLVMASGSVFVLGVLINWAAAALLAFTIFFYVVIYTMWLKRRTPQNIVIGGAAGAFPPMIGWAAVTGGIDIGSIALFLIIFLWTPAHFWALALLRCDDYARAGVPMLPVVAGPRETRKQILVYAVLTVAASRLADAHRARRPGLCRHRRCGRRRSPGAVAGRLPPWRRHEVAQGVRPPVRLFHPLSLRALCRPAGGMGVQVLGMRAMEYRSLTPQEEARRRRRSIAIGLALGALVVLFFITTIVRLAGNVAGG